MVAVSSHRVGTVGHSIVTFDGLYHFPSLGDKVYSPEIRWGGLLPQVTTLFCRTLDWIHILNRSGLIGGCNLVYATRAQSPYILAQIAGNILS